MTHWKKYSRIIFLCGVLLLVCSAGTAAAEQNYLVMYVIGSDLESNPPPEQEGAATADFVKLIDGWDDTAGDVFIIYGGANKTGWDEGVSLTNLTLLKNDYDEDGVVGSDYGKPTKFIRERMDLGIATQEALTQSLKRAEEYRTEVGISDAANRYLIFWDHGAGYKGYGQDEVNSTNEKISLSQLANGLEDSGTTYTSHWI